MSKHRDIMLENPEMSHENPAEWELRQELDRMGVENDPVPDKCPKCGSQNYKSVGGMVGEEMILCADCDAFIWCDDEGAIRSVF